MKHVVSKKYATLVASVVFGFASQAFADPATSITTKANEQVLKDLPFKDRREFEEAARGLLIRPDTLTIKDHDGKVVWDMGSYKKFITQDAPAPASVNPSLWRNAQLNIQYGLYEVMDGIYQVRGFDLSNITFVRGDTGWIVFDVGSTAETAKAAFDLLTQKFGAKPIVAVIYSHPHHDHYGGVKGLITDEDVRSGKVRLIGPEGFMEAAVNEGVIAGNAMTRRSIFMYGALLPRGPEGGVSAGLGMTNPRGEGGLIEPSEYITKDGEKLIVDGVEMEFQMTPGTESPAEMNTYLPKFRAMWMAENTVSTMHNILTLRGAPVRDPLAWAKYINTTIERYGDKVDVKFQSHHWPTWGNADVIDYLKKQRDLYKFIHDRSVNLMNQGYTGEEISEMIKLPKSLEDFWPGRGYYGTLRHNSRAVYQRYMGWYDGNPSSLNNLPPVDAAKKYVEYMGGEASILKKAQADFNKGEYRWTAMVLKHVVFANPSNAKAKELLAKSYEQMGYQAESGPWRSVYLQGAYELRHGAPQLKSAGSASPDVIRAMNPEMLFDYLAVRLDAEKAEGQTLSMNVTFTDLNKTYNLAVEDSVLVYGDVPDPKATATATLTKSALDDVSLGERSLDDQVKAGNIKLDGDKTEFRKLLGLIGNFDLGFNIVTP